MHSSLLPYFKKLNAQLDSLPVELSVFSHEELSRRPAPNAWSVLEIIQHMMIAEKGSLAYVKKKTSYPDSLNKAGISNRWRIFQMYLFLHLPIKVKAPAVVAADKFRQDVTLETLLTEWKTNRAELNEFLENAPADWLNKLTYRHGFAGRITFDGMLLFFRDHFVRHRKQIDRTLAIVAKK